MNGEAKDQAISSSSSFTSEADIHDQKHHQRSSKYTNGHVHGHGHGHGANGNEKQQRQHQQVEDSGLGSSPAHEPNQQLKVSVEGGSGKRNVVVVQEQSRSATQTQQSHSSSRKKERGSGRQQKEHHSNQSKNNNWYLKDPKGTKLGPFSARELVSWFEAGLMVCDGDGNWEHLAKLKKTEQPQQHQSSHEKPKEQHQTHQQQQQQPKREQAQQENNKSLTRPEAAAAQSSQPLKKPQQETAAPAPTPTPVPVPVPASPSPSPSAATAANEKRRGGGGGGGGSQPHSQHKEHNTPTKKFTPQELFTAGAQKPMDEPVWRYVDNEGQIQGPWTSKQMISWYQQGYFDMDLLVVGCDRKICPPNLPKREEYVALGKLLHAPSQRSSGQDGKGSRYNNGYRRGGRKHNYS